MIKRMFPRLSSELIIRDNIYQAFFDQLLRVLSRFKNQPAIIILGAWSPQVAQDVGYADPQMVHLPIAHYYDIPYISYVLSTSSREETEASSRQSGG